MFDFQEPIDRYLLREAVTATILRLYQNFCTQCRRYGQGVLRHALAL